MTQDSSLVGVFDLKSQAGVMKVLAAIRASQLSPAEKNELRDLIFAYTNGGGDASVLIALEQKLKSHKIIPTTGSAPVASAAPVLTYGSQRPVPSFKTPAALTKAAMPVPPPEVQRAVVPEPVVAAPVVTAVEPSLLVTDRLPLVAVAETLVAPVSAPVTEVPASVPVMAAEPTPPVTPSSPSTSSDSLYLDRIRQIKTAVNSKVGNPVNLVDIDNEVGREYMNALLEAMKKLGSGAVSEMGPVMERLETSFVAVEAAIKKHESSKGSTTPAVTVVPPTVSPAPVPVPVPEPVPVPKPEPIPVAPLPPQRPPEPTIMPEPVVVAAPTPVLGSIPPLSPVINKPQDSAVLREQTAAASPVEENPAPFVAPTTNHSEEPSGFSMAASSVPINVERVLPANDPLAQTVSTRGGDLVDLLYTAEVDDGLNQLLSDWSLFKKSGLFGTGPKGREHPLYKKISDLQVPFLLAGRFDGATQEIRQSITDYMNGWRYEQGIIYQPGETFEKYLRRVIKHILDLQKKRRQA